MNPQIAEKDSAANAVTQTVTDRQPAKPKAKARVSAGKPDKKSKKDQLIALLSKPNGVRVSLLVDRLGWQAHTVRAALSGLRKQGFKVAASKSTKTGEAVYTIASRARDAGVNPDEVLS